MPLYALIQQPAASAPGTDGAPAAPRQSVPLWDMMMPLAVMGLAFYFIILRPAQRQEKQRKAQLNQLKKNDEVVFGGGIIGRVVEIKEKQGGVAGLEDVVVVRVDDKTRFTVLRSAIGRVHSGDEAEKKDAAGK